MSAEKKYTERDLILAQREASAKARCAALNSADPFPGRSLHNGHVNQPCVECAKKAGERYPLPMVKRPREVADPHGDLGFMQVWRVVNGVIQWDVGAGWNTLEPTAFRPHPWVITDVTPERIKVWADLIANSTETVEDGAA